ncbi:MAG: TatD family hydrolase [bacterium]
MIFVDTHAHLFMDDYDADRREVIECARQASVAAIFDVGLDIETNRAVIDGAAGGGPVFAIVGNHPNLSNQFDPTAFADFLDEYDGKYIALGEMGLDYYRERSAPDVQRKALEQQLAMFIPKGKPLIFHCREADADMLAALEAVGAQIKGVMHCFSGDLAFLERTLALGLHISVGGPVTYPKNEKLCEVVKTVPIDRLLLETDCPFLAPQKKRGKRNEPVYIPMIAAKIAELRGATLADIADATTRNVIELFGEPVAAWLRR